MLGSKKKVGAEAKPEDVEKQHELLQHALTEPMAQYIAVAGRTAQARDDFISKSVFGLIALNGASMAGIQWLLGSDKGQSILNLTANEVRFSTLFFLLGIIASVGAAFFHRAHLAKVADASGALALLTASAVTASRRRGDPRALSALDDYFEKAEKYNDAMHSGSKRARVLEQFSGAYWLIGILSVTFRVTIEAFWHAMF